MSTATISDGLAKFIRDARNAPLLDREAEHALAVRARDGDTNARDELVRTNVRHVVSLALKHRRRGLRLAELISEGNVGLVIAASKFDPDRGTRFVTYASYWIRAYLLDFIVRSASVVGGGSGALRSKLFFKIRRERAQLAAMVGTDADRNTALAERLGVSEDRAAEMAQRVEARDASLDAPLGAETATTLLDQLRSPAPSQEELAADAEESARVSREVRSALQHLDRRERFIVERRIMADEAMSLAAIGRKLGVSRERARQLEVRAKRKLRCEITAQSGRDAAGWA